MKKLFYVRHGLTEMNVAGVFSGRTETSLTDEGRQQAIATGQKLKSDVPPIDYIVCSPYERTYETAKLIAEQIGFPVQDIERNQLFVERSFGPLEGTPGDDFFGEHDYKDLDSVVGAETVEQMQQRATEALNHVRSIDKDNVLVVGHGAFGRAFRRVVNGMPHTDEYNKQYHIGTAEIIELV
jgi:alpha-ribazole phosphatase